MLVAIADGGMRQVRPWTRSDRVGRAAHVEGIDISFAPAIRPAHVEPWSCDWDQQRWKGWNRCVPGRAWVNWTTGWRCADDEAARKFIGWVSERLKRIGASASTSSRTTTMSLWRFCRRICANRKRLRTRYCRRRRRDERKPILSGGIARLDRKGFVGRANHPERHRLWRCGRWAD